MELREELKGETVLVTGASRVWVGQAQNILSNVEAKGSFRGGLLKNKRSSKSLFRSPKNHLAFSGDMLIEIGIHSLVEKIIPLIAFLSSSNASMMEDCCVPINAGKGYAF